MSQKENQKADRIPTSAQVSDLAQENARNAPQKETEGDVTQVQNTSRKKGSINQRSFRSSRFGNSKNSRLTKDRRKSSKDSRYKDKKEDEAILHSAVITVKRVTRVVKGGKRMRFAAMVVVGDKAGSVGFGFKKGLDYQDALDKATRQASKNLLKIRLNEDKSIDFPVNLKYKSVKVFLKPAYSGTGLIAGGFVRPVLELAGIENIYSKILGSRNKIAGVQATFEALKRFS